MYRWLLKHMLIGRLWTTIDAHYADSPLYKYAQRSRRYTLYILSIGALWTLLICQTMGNSSRQAVVDMLSIVPNGTRIGTGMFICIGTMHRLIDRYDVMATGVWLARIAVLTTWVYIQPPSSPEQTNLLICMPTLTLWAPALMLWWGKLYDLTLAPLLGMTFAHTFQEHNTTPSAALIVHGVLLFFPFFVAFQVQQGVVQGNVFQVLLGTIGNLLLFFVLCEAILRGVWFGVRQSMHITPTEATAVLEADL